MKRIIGLAIAGLLATATSATASEPPQIGDELRASAAKAAADETVRPSGNQAGVARSKSQRHIKMKGWYAQAVTDETAFYVFLEITDATQYGAYGCKRYSPYGFTCVGWISGTIYDPISLTEHPFSCDWFQDVWINKKNQLRTWPYQEECYGLPTYSQRANGSGG